MSDLALRPRSVSELVDAAFQLYRRDAMQYMLIVALAYAPWLVIQLLFVGDAAEQVATGNSGAMFIAGFGAFIAFSIASAMLIKHGAAAYLGEQPELGDSLRAVLPKTGHVILAGIGRYILSMLGLLALIIGIFYVLARTFALTPAIVLEDKGAGAAFGRSSELSKGLKRHIINTYLLAGIIYLIGSMAVGFLAAMGGSVAQQVLSALFTIVAYPVLGLLEMLLYYDARVRKEGFDLEVMAGTAQPSAAAAV